MLARDNEVTKQLKFKSPKTKSVAMDIIKYTEERQKRTFQLSRERDELSLRLGNPKHVDRVRGLQKRITCKESWKWTRTFRRSMEGIRSQALNVN